MPLEFFSHSKYEEQEIALEVEDKVFFYTDGILEARNNNKEFFGTDRLKNIILQHKDKSTSAITSLIMKSLLDFTEGVKFNDDVTFIAMELI